MEQTVYGDVLFVINFSMDFVALYITAKILHIKARTLTLSLAAALGAVYSVASLFFKGAFPLALAIDIAVSALMCLVGYRKLTGKSFFLAWFLFFAVSALLGGSITAIYSLINSALGKRANVGHPSEAYSGLPADVFVIIALFSVALTYVGGRLLSRTAQVKSIEVTVTHGERSVTFAALLDSGNLLREPISGRPVILANVESVAPVLPYEVLSLMRRGAYDKLGILSAASLRRTRLIPAKGIGEEKILIGFIPEKITVKRSGRAGARCVDAVIAVDTRAMCDFGGFEAVISPSLVGV